MMQKNMYACLRPVHAHITCTEFPLVYRRELFGCNVTLEPIKCRMDSQTCATWWAVQMNGAEISSPQNVTVESIFVDSSPNTLYFQNIFDPIKIIEKIMTPL